MNHLAELCFNWAQQFTQTGIRVACSERFDQDYGQYLSIEIEPPSIEQIMVEIIVTEESIGFTIENWRRLHARAHQITLDEYTNETPDRVGAFVEPGVVTIYRCAEILDAIASGRAGITINLFRGRITSTKALIRLDCELIYLNGPSLWTDTIRCIFGGETLDVSYLGWSDNAFSLAENIRGAFS
ncbi:hypothetical protein [Methylocystis heyeri]|uniref:Uncharacterized protein n=1 Tax=Methylocystis heyeri TaxID=391905 RepID=A0A6B8KCF0_9HYPH|nr:hypothetical protein [Methylocystis heyeri]QGM45347.1 hypothetical protein H2LOC_006350 [Methylocystis heyeri]